MYIILLIVPSLPEDLGCQYHLEDLEDPDEEEQLV